MLEEPLRWTVYHRTVICIGSICSGVAACLARFLCCFDVAIRFDETASPKTGLRMVLEIYAYDFGV